MGGAVSPQSANSERGGLEPVDGVYQIGSAEELQEFAKLVNDDGETTANAVLTADINLNPDMKIDEDGTVTGNPDQWTPIGNSSNEYTGTFNGDGHTISGLYINNSSADYQGLFGYLSTDDDNIGTVQNLTVSGTVSGRIYVGGVVGLNLGSVENCHNTGSVTSSGSPVGGVVGYNGGTVKNCYNTGTVTGSGTPVGGVVGYNYIGGSVTNCYNTGTVTVTGTDDYLGGVGGVVGYNHGGRVENCYNTGSVNVSGGISVGGVVGLNENGFVENCYNIGKVPGSTDSSNVGGVVGHNFGSTVTGCYFLQQEPEISGIGNGGGEPDETAVDDLDALCENFKGVTGWKTNTTLKRPVLTSNHEDDGSEQHPYEIFTATQLENFRDLVNDEGGNPAAWAVLMENITLNSSEEWTPNRHQQPIQRHLRWQRQDHQYLHHRRLSRPLWLCLRRHREKPQRLWHSQ